jgi:hypothetical protein
MKKGIGIWVDHRKAVIVSPVKPTPKLWRVDSDIEDHTKISKGWRPNMASGSMDFVAEDHHQRNIQDHLNKYYDEVINSMGEPEQILIFGPGPAKVELKKRLESMRPEWPEPVIEPADRMTENEIIQKVKEYYKPKTMTAHR